MDIVDAIVKFMAVRCVCAFTADQLTDRVFLCHPSSPQSVTYQAQLHGTLLAPVTDLITLIEEWASSGDTILVQFLPLKLEGACASFDSSTVECKVIEPTEMEDETLSEVTESTEKEDVTLSEVTESTEIRKGTFDGIQSITVMAGVVAVFVVMALVIIILVSIIITIKIRRVKPKPKDESE